MRMCFNTSLISVLTAAALCSDAFAAASVRSIGGAGTLSSTSSAAAETSARAGSLRATGGSVRTTPVSSATKSATGTMPATTTNISRAASAPRLSIGKYVGVPKSISEKGTANITEDRISEIERQIEKLETEKQMVLKNSDYITVVNNEVLLNTERLIADLEISDGTDGTQ